MTTIEGNKLIAEFDGYTFEPDSILNKVKGVFQKEGKLSMLENEIKYHSSWDWRQPTIEKIVSLGYNVEQIQTPTYAAFRIYANKDISSCGAIVKETAWEAIIQFIQWYNTQNNQTNKK